MVVRSIQSGLLGSLMRESLSPDSQIRDTMQCTSGSSVPYLCGCASAILMQQLWLHSLFKERRNRSCDTKAY